MLKFPGMMNGESERKRERGQAKERVSVHFAIYILFVLFGWCLVYFLCILHLSLSAFGFFFVCFHCSICSVLCAVNIYASSLCRCFAAGTISIVCIFCMAKAKSILEQQRAPNMYLYCIFIFIHKIESSLCLRSVPNINGLVSFVCTQNMEWKTRSSEQPFLFQCVVCWCWRSRYIKTCTHTEQER